MKYHLVAIGGAVMHNVALALRAQGHEVTGSDDVINEPSRSRLATAGLLPDAAGWFPERITTDTDAVILGMHAHADNPELARAREMGIRVLSFPEFVRQQATDKQRIVVAGSHGKTTVTSMLLHVLRQEARDFDYLVGAQVQGFDTMVRMTEDAPIAVVEGDEYPTTALDPRPKFLHYEPNILVLTGIAWDHINAFPTERTYFAAFEKLLLTLPKAATVVYNKEDRAVRDIIATCTDKTKHYLVPYETPKSKNKGGQEWVKVDKKDYPVKVYGEHNHSNMAAAYEVLRQLAFPSDVIMRHLGTFRGAAMRMEHLYESDKMLVIRDFAHAPSKVRATFEAVTARYTKERNIIPVLELSTYSSLTPNFLPQFKNVLKKAKEPIVYINPENLEVKRMQPLTQEQLRAAFLNKTLVLITKPEDLERRIRARITGRDALLLMSSGNLGGFDWQKLV